MQITVYADVLFLVNWLMDYALLRAVASILHLRVNGIRLSAAAAVGAIWVCVVAVFSLPAWLEMVGSLLLISSAMIRIAFKPKGKTLFSRCLMSLYGIAFLGGGAVNLLYFHTGIGAYLKETVWGHSESQLPFVAVVISAASVYGVVRFVRSIMRYGKRQGCFYQAQLFWGGSSAALNALLDTGNQLREPVTGKAVHIVEKNAIAFMEPDRDDAVRMLVPFHAVGTESGLLMALRFDRMELTAGDGKKITVERPLIGLYDGKLSAHGEYQLILHTEIETRQGERL